MIDRVHTGWNPGGLLTYLFGPGRYNEHTQPRLVATWDGRPHVLQPEHVGPDEFDYDLTSLTTVLQAPLQAAGLPVTNPAPHDPAHAQFFTTAPDGTFTLRTGPVRHLTLRNASEDRTLTDAEWAAIAEEVVDRAGWSRRDDPDRPRWLAVRHDDDGIHLVAVMVRPHTQQRVWPANDYFQIRRALQNIEHRWGLTVTASADRTAAPQPTRAETEKAARYGNTPARDELRNAVSQAAAATMNVEEFGQALVQAGYRVEFKRQPAGAVLGYKVARRGDVNRIGTPVWFSGSTLAPDLSLPKLATRWNQARRGQRSLARARNGPAAADGQPDAVAILERAWQTVHEDPAQADGIAHALGEVLAAEDRRHGHVLSGRSAQWDRAARAPYRPVSGTQVAADELRYLARSLAQAQATPGAQLVVAIAALALQIAALLHESGREHQARAARATAGWSPPSRQGPRPTQPASSRGPGRGGTTPRARQQRSLSSGTPTSTVRQHEAGPSGPATDTDPNSAPPHR